LTGVNRTMRVAPRLVGQANRHRTATGRLHVCTNLCGARRQPRFAAHPWVGQSLVRPADRPVLVVREGQGAGAAVLW